MKFEAIKDIADKVFRDMLNEDNNPASENYPQSKTKDYHFHVADIDSYIGALNPGEFYSVAGRPGMGKTTLLINTAVHNALEGKPVYCVSLETSLYKTVEEMIPIITGFDIGYLDDAPYNYNHREVLLNAWERIRSLPIFFAVPQSGEDYSSISVIGSAARDSINGGLLLVDYIQLISAEGTNDERMHTVAEELKHIAEECHSPVIVTSQLCRNVEARENKMPRVSDINEDLRFCSAASMVLFREDFYDRKAEPGFAVIMQTKQMDEEIIASCEAFYEAGSLHTDRLSFKLSDPKELGEEWALKLQESPTVAEVYINGEELIPIVRERECIIKDADDLCEPGSYGHLSVDELYRELHEAQTGQYEYAHLLCCNNCGDCFCWSVQAKISVGLKYVTWTISHNHRDWEYDLTYRFDKQMYSEFIKKSKLLLSKPHRQ